MLTCGARVSYVVGTVKHNGRVLVCLDAATVLVSDDASSTTQRVLAQSALTDLTPPPPATVPPTPVPPVGVVGRQSAVGTILQTVTGKVVDRVDSNTEYVGCTFDLGVQNAPHDVRFRDCHFNYLNLATGERYEFIGGDFGPMAGGVHAAISNGFSPTLPCAKDIVFDGVRFHGMHQGALSDHTEGLQLGAAKQLTIRNCVFEDNHVFNVFARCWNDQGIDSVLIEANTFKPTAFIDGTAGTYCLRIAGDGDAVAPSNVIVRSNQVPAGQPISIDASALAKGCREYSNTKA